MKNLIRKLSSSILVVMFLFIFSNTAEAFDLTTNLNEGKVQQLEKSIVDNCGKDTLNMLKEQFSSQELLNLYQDGKLQFTVLNNSPNIQAETNRMTLTTVIFDDYYDMSDNRTYAKLCVFWNWKNRPMRLHEDAIAIGWTEGMYGNAHIHDNIMNVNYYNFDNEPVDRVDYSRNITTPNPSMNAVAKIPMGNSYRWAKHGNIFMRISKHGRVHELAMAANYGHASIDVDFGLTAAYFPLSLTFDDEHVEEVILDTGRYVQITKVVP